MSLEPTDRELLDAWRGGDNTAGSTLVKRHFHALHRFFTSKALGHREDLIQETFLACVESKDAYRGEGSFRAYLFGLARFQLLTHYRKTHRLRQIDFTTSTVRDFGTSVTGQLARHQEEQLLRLALTHVPIDQQIALELTYWECLPAHEIARVLEIPENTVYSRVRRAKARLREALATLAPNAEEQARAFALLACADDK
jgi:RNA polymerase sigma-70 factor (ECF subfamily)